MIELYLVFINKMICFLIGATFGFFLTALSYFLFSSPEDSTFCMENKHRLIMERIQTLEDRIDDIIDQFEGDSDSDEENERFSDDASSHSHQSHATEEGNGASHAPDPDPSHPTDRPSWGGEDMDHDEGDNDQVHIDHDGEHTHTLHETVDVEHQSVPLVLGEMTETDGKKGVEDDLLSL